MHLENETRSESVWNVPKLVNLTAADASKVGSYLNSAEFEFFGRFYQAPTS